MLCCADEKKRTNPLRGLFFFFSAEMLVDVDADCFRMPQLRERSFEVSEFGPLRSLKNETTNFWFQKWEWVGWVAAIRYGLEMCEFSILLLKLPNQQVECGFFCAGSCQNS